MNTILARVFTKPFLITILRYALATVGAWLVANYNFDPGKLEVISGALLTIAVALMGGAESVKDKVVVDGKAVAKEKLPVSVQQDIKDAAKARPSRSALDILLGK